MPAVGLGRKSVPRLHSGQIIMKSILSLNDLNILLNQMVKTERPLGSIGNPFRVYSSHGSAYNWR